MHRARSVALLLKHGADPNLVVNGDVTSLVTTRAEDAAVIDALLD